MGSDTIVNYDKGRQFLFKVLFGICLIGLILSTYYLVLTIKDTRKIKREYHELSQFVNENEYEEKQVTQKMDKSQHRKIEKKLKKKNINTLFSMNQDFIGWLSIEGTEINYPVMQKTKNQDFYLNHDFYKKSNRHGVPFLDIKCDVENKKSSLLIYGHHMKDGTMFAGLMKYKKKEYYERNRIITFTTLKENSYYEVCAVCLVNTQTDIDLLKWLSSEHTKDEVATYKEKIKSTQLYSCEREIGKEPHLSLVTCEYSKENMRLLVIANKVKKQDE